MLEISQREYTNSSLLGNDETIPDGLRPDPVALIRSLAPGLHVLGTGRAYSWPLHVKRQLMTVELQLYSYVFSLDTGTERDILGGNDLSESPEIANYVSKAYLLALKIIDEALAEEAQVKSWTFFDFHNLMHAVMVLLYISRQYPQTSDQVEAKDAIQQAWRLYKSRQLTEGDHFHRLCDVIEYISNTDWSNDVMELAETRRLLVRSRMSANVVYDVIARAKVRYLLGKKKRLKEQLPERAKLDLRETAAQAGEASDKMWPQQADADYSLASMDEFLVQEWDMGLLTDSFIS